MWCIHGHKRSAKAGLDALFLLPSVFIKHHCKYFFCMKRLYSFTKRALLVTFYTAPTLVCFLFVIKVYNQQKYCHIFETQHDFTSLMALTVHISVIVIDKSLCIFCLTVPAIRKLTFPYFCSFLTWLLNTLLVRVNHQHWKVLEVQLEGNSVWRKCRSFTEGLQL